MTRQHNEPPHTPGIWRCPVCHSELAITTAAAFCDLCQRTYPCYSGIYDFRLGGPAWIDLDDDRSLALELLTDTDATAETLARRVFGRRPAWTQERAAALARVTFAGVEHLADDIGGWLAPALAVNGTVLDLGCGPGVLMAACSAAGRHIIGIDVSLTWLVVARALIRERGGTPVLAAAFGEALPLADGTVAAVLSLDVIEHVGGRQQYVSEIARVLANDGCLALSTPNRFSLAAEPHIGVWGVGWLPRRWQRPFAEWRSGLSYRSTWLFSAGELLRTLSAGGVLHCRISAPKVPEPSIARFPPRRAMLARLYNRFVSAPLFQQVALWFGPFLRVVAFKRSPV